MLVDEGPVEARLKIVQPVEKQLPQCNHPFSDQASNIKPFPVVDTFWAIFLQSKERKRLLPVFCIMVQKLG